MQPRNLFFGALSLALLAQISPIQPHGWTLEADRFVSVTLSGGVRPMGVITEADFRSDGKMEEVSIVHNTARITAGTSILWQSPSPWQVMEAQVADLNHDGASEAALLVWRPFQPWPVDQWLPAGGRIRSFHDAQGNSCHLILIGWKNGEFREVWAGSALAEPVKSFYAVDLDRDGRQELVTLEGSYQDARQASARMLKVWKWNGFGFSNVSRMDGRFDTMALALAGNGQALILVP